MLAHLKTTFLPPRYSEGVEEVVPETEEVEDSLEGKSRSKGECMCGQDPRDFISFKM